MTLGEQIKSARERKHLSQEALADQLNVSRQAVSKWETNQSVPQGLNRDLLTQILDLELTKADEPVANSKHSNILGRLGWAVAVIAMCLLWIVLTGQSRSSEAADPNAQTPNRITSIRFFDGDQNEVIPEALWYNAANMESILIQWEGASPHHIKVFATPSGTETAEMTKLLLTKAIPDGESVALLDADALKDGFQNHVYFELDFGTETVSSDVFHVFFDGVLSELS